MSDRCDYDVYEKGRQVFLTQTIRASNIETWVQKIAADSGQQVDWHYAGGRAIILALGDIEKVRESILQNRQMHDDFYIEEAEKYLPNHNHQRHIDGIWRYNGF